MASLNFDATQIVPDSGQMDPVPAGWYNVIMDESELKPTADGSGMRLATRFSILDGDYVGRKIFTGFNIRNANPVAQEIAYKQLSALAHSVGVLQVQDSQQLHGIPLKVRVKIRPARDGYDAQNEITAYKNATENVGDAGTFAPPAASPAGFAPPAPVAPPAGFAPPPAATVAPPAPQQAWQPPAAPQPWQAPVPPAPVPPAPVPPAPVPPAPVPPAPASAFPPEGWLPHPSSPGFYYKGNEVKTTEELKALVPPPAPPAPPAAPEIAEADPDGVMEAQSAIPPWQRPKE